MTEEADNGLFTFGLWVATIVMICMAIAWGLVAMGFAVLNASTKPIETITGPVGLYLWNLLASKYLLLCACKCVIAHDTVFLPTLFIGGSRGGMSLESRSGPISLIFM